MKMLRKFITRASQVLNFISEWPGLLAILIMAVTVVMGVTSRYIFHYPLHFVDEYNGYLNAVVIMLPLAYVLKRAGHIRLSVVVNALPQRVAKSLDLVTILVSFSIVIVLIISAIRLVIKSFASGTLAYTVLATPLAPVQLIIPIGLVLFAIQIMVEIAKRIRTWGILQEGIASD